MRITRSTKAAPCLWAQRSRAWILLLTVALVACGSSDKDQDRAAAPEPIHNESSAAVTGTLLYEFIPSRDRCAGLDYNRVEQRPIRGATVQLIHAANGSVLDATHAADDGSFQLSAAPGQQVLVRVRAELKRSGVPGWDVEVRDNTAATQQPLGQRPVYVLEGSPFALNEAGDERQLIARSGWDGRGYGDHRASAPFSILDSLYASMALVRQADPLADFPPLDVFWSINNGTTVSDTTFEERMSAGQIGTSFYSPAHYSMFLLGHADHDTEEFDHHVIVHEWAHYFEQAFSRSDSPGGSHSLYEFLDKRLAFSEGWATALSGIVLESSLYCDTSGPAQGRGFIIDMADTPPSGSGWFNEWSMIRLMYALWAPGNPEMGFEFSELYQVFTNEQRSTEAFASIFSFASALKERYPQRALRVESLLSDYGINGTDAYGSNEFNNAGSQQPDVLPIYRELVADGSALTLCVNDEFDVGRAGNKLSQFRYLRLRVDQPGLYALSVETQNPPTPDDHYACQETGQAQQHSDPDFRLLRGGQMVLNGDSCSANNELTHASLASGNYALAIRESRFADSSTAAEFPNRICFAVSATPLF